MFAFVVRRALPPSLPAPSSPSFTTPSSPPPSSPCSPAPPTTPPPPAGTLVPDRGRGAPSPAKIRKQRRRTL